MNKFDAVLLQPVNGLGGSKIMEMLGKIGKQMPRLPPLKKPLSNYGKGTQHYYNNQDAYHAGKYFNLDNYRYACQWAAKEYPEMGIICPEKRDNFFKRAGSALEDVAVAALNPTVALNVASTPGGTVTVEKAAKELERSEIAQAAAAMLLNPSLAFQGAQSYAAAKNPEETAILAAAAAAIALSGGTAAAAAPGIGSTTAQGFGATLVKGIGGAAIAGGGQYVAALATGANKEEAQAAAQNAAQQSAAQGFTSGINSALGFLGQSGLDLTPLTNMLNLNTADIGAYLAQQLNNPNITQQQRQAINTVVGQMQAQGKSDSEIIGELLKSRWFNDVASANAYPKVWETLYSDAYQQLTRMGYDHVTASRIATQFADQYAAKNTAYAIEKVKQKGPLNFDPKLLFAAAAIILPVLMMR